MQLSTVTVFSGALLTSNVTHKKNKYRKANLSTGKGVNRLFLAGLVAFKKTPYTHKFLWKKGITVFQFFTHSSLQKASSSLRFLGRRACTGLLRSINRFSMMFRSGAGGAVRAVVFRQWWYRPDGALICKPVFYYIVLFLVTSLPGLISLTCLICPVLVFPLLCPLPARPSCVLFMCLAVCVYMFLSFFSPLSDPCRSW